MTRRTVTHAVALALAVLLALPAAAGAVTGHKPAGATPALSERALADRFLPVARSYWPGAPCTGRELVDVDAGAAIDAVNPGAQGLAFPDECRIALRAGMPPTEFCVTLAHELGHLAGHGHAPTGLMSERSAEVGACVDGAAAEQFAYEWRQAIAELPGGGVGWRVTRSRVRREDGTTGYIAARRGFLRRLILEVPVSEVSFRRAVMGPTVLIGSRHARRGGARGVEAPPGRGGSGALGGSSR